MIWLHCALIYEPVKAHGILAICTYYYRVSFILDEQIGAVLRLSLNRPEKKNAITQDMYQRLADKINEAAGDF